MAETYLEITQQIEELKQKAEMIRESEVAGVVERIKTAIRAYGLTAEQLFDAPPAAGPKPSRTGAGRTPEARGQGASSSPRFRDDSGNSWSGRGPRPRWIKAALAAGRSMEDFAVGPAPGEDGGRAARRSSAKLAKPGTTAKYRDGEGRSWSGRGPRPGWVKAALETGKTLDQLRA